MSIVNADAKSLEFENRFVIDPLTNCWNWIGPKHRQGYGYHKQMMAHRYSYKYYKDDFNPTMCVCHKCDNPSCVNPDIVRHIRKKEMQQRAYAKLYGLCQRTVAEIQKKLTWKHVADQPEIGSEGRDQ